MGYTPPYLEVRKTTGGWLVYGPSITSTDDTYVYANIADATARITLEGLGNIKFAHAAGSQVQVFDGTTGYLLTYYGATDGAVIKGYVADKDLSILTTGTGVLRFGTWTGSGDVAVNGSIAVKDAAGNARKLATVA